MAKTITLKIDDREITVPDGMLVVNAAKLIGIDIPVFCYHPKMEPVGMCRMCLVEIGRPVRNRQTGELEKNEDGTPKISFGPKLEFACTTPVSDGMVVIGTSDKVNAGRKDILEFLLTSHPLDCPICDKGGECPLQNQTMGWGPGETRFIYEEKMRLAKQYPLGDLIVLDRERCIQCARCVRFQDEVVDDPVIGFYNRGRQWEIISYSDPGFDSYFSGNTTDICPVGALTTTDFRFRARPWELKAAASICTQCPVGCNLTYNVRREAISGGEWMIKRTMPRQNEWVNEIWICDKGRFGYHYAAGQQRLLSPMIRKGGELVQASWEEALELVAQRFRQAGNGLVTVAGGRLANEDLFSLRQLTEGLGGRPVLYTNMAGGDLTSQVGFAPGTNFGEMGPETAILVIASDLLEEAPIWWLRIKQAAERGAKLIVANPRPTKLEKYTEHVIRYPYGSEAGAVLALLNTLSAKRPDLPESTRTLERDAAVQAAAGVIREAENLVVVYGSEGTSLESSAALAQACANLLVGTGHTGRPNNGLLAVWHGNNEQGAWELGFRPDPDLAEVMKGAKALYIAGANPAGEDPSLAETGDFLVVQDLTLTSTARLADVVLPVTAFDEREGSFTSGERRVQRFYPAVPASSMVKPDYLVTAEIAYRLGIELEARSPARIMTVMAQAVPTFAGVDYPKISATVEQWPIVGRGDMYYGGTGYDNHQGLGMQLPLSQAGAGGVTLGWIQPGEIQVRPNELLGVPVNRLYDRGDMLLPSTLLEQRIPNTYVVLNPADASRLKAEAGSTVQVTVGGVDVLADAKVDENVPAGVVLIPRSMGIPISGPGPVRVAAAEPTVA